MFVFPIPASLGPTCSQHSSKLLGTSKNQESSMGPKKSQGYLHDKKEEELNAADRRRADGEV